MPRRSARWPQKIRHEVEAEGQRLMNEAQNVLSPEARASMLRRLLIEHLEAIMRESVKPLEKIDEIKILQVDGLLGGARRRRRHQRRLSAAEPQRPDRQQRAALSRARPADRQAAQGDRPAGGVAAAGDRRRSGAAARPGQGQAATQPIC